MKKILNFISCLTGIFCFIASNASAQACDLLSEGFTTTTPSMPSLTISFVNIANGDKYTSAGNFGAASPSIMMNATGDEIDIFNGTDNSPNSAKSLHFWIKGQGTNSTSPSSLTIEQSFNGSSWQGIAVISPIPTVGTTKKYNLSVIPSTPYYAARVRIIYTKDAGNLGFDDICISSTVLPVEIMSFSAKKVGNTPKLIWQTASETNNAFFNIERSSNGSTFEKIGEIKGGGNSLEVKITLLRMKHLWQTSIITDCSKWILTAQRRCQKL